MTVPARQTATRRGQRVNLEQNFEKFTGKKDRRGPGRQTEPRLTSSQRSDIEGRIMSLFQRHHNGAMRVRGGSLEAVINEALRVIGQQKRYVIRGAYRPRECDTVLRDVLSGMVRQQVLVWDPASGHFGLTARRRAGRR